MNNATHQGIREAIRARIVAAEWDLGERIPGEVDLAEEYGCSRTTVNRALQTLADEGVVERKRKGGTRVRPLPLPQSAPLLLSVWSKPVIQKTWRPVLSPMRERWVSSSLLRPDL